MGARRGGNNKRDFSSFPIRKRIDEESAPVIDWDDINRQYVSLIKVKVYFYNIQMGFTRSKYT